MDGYKDKKKKVPIINRKENKDKKEEGRREKIRETWRKGGYKTRVEERRR